MPTDGSTGSGGAGVIGPGTARVTVASDDPIGKEYAGDGAGIYSLTFSAVAASAAQDVFELVAPAGKDLVLHKIILGQYSDFGDAQAELLSVLVLRGYTTTGSGGAAVTPASFSGDGTASATAARNNTTVAADGTAVTLVADAWNVAAGWLWAPAPRERIVIPAGVRLVVRITAPADAITLNGTLIFEEIG